MRNFLFLLCALLTAGTAFAQTPSQGLQPIMIGLPIESTTQGNSQYSTNAAGARNCFSFFLTEAKTLSKAKVQITAVTGSPSAAETQLDIVNDASGFPSGSSIESRGLAGAPTAAVNEWTGYTASLSANTLYHACLKNTNATPASNYTTIRVQDSSSLGNSGVSQVLGSTNVWGWTFCNSADSGATCATRRKAIPFLQLEFSDGTFAGGGILLNSVSWETTNTIYSARELGVTFTVPADGPGLKVRCASMSLLKNGTVPSGGMRYRLYSGTGASRTLVATSATVPAANYGDGWMPACFTSTQTLAAGTAYSIVLGVVSGGDVSNYLMISKVGIDNTTAAKALTFLGATKSTYLNGTFSDNDQAVNPFVLMLDTNDPFDVASGATGRPSKYNIGFN